MNAVGVEGFDGSDERCLKLKGALNQPCVKGITVRDDFDLLVRHYLDDEKEWLERVLDPAAFVHMCMDVKVAAALRSLVLG